MAGRGRPNLKRRVYGKGKPGVPFIPVIPPKPAEDASWDDYWWKWVANGTPVDETKEPPAYEEKA